MNKRIFDFIINRGLDLKGSNVIAGFSGGPDSMVLIRFLLYMRENHQLTFRIMHLNHNERADADNEERFVREFCNRNDIPASMYSEDICNSDEVKHLGFERYARERRKYYFDKECTEYHCDYILTGHNMTDRVETMLINMERGTGLRGLVSMKFIQGKYVKPLIFLTGQEIRSFISAHKIDIIDDDTNRDESFKRNEIRKHIMPILKKYMSNGYDSINRSLNNAERSEYVLEKLIQENIKYIAQYSDSGISINIDKLNSIGEDYTDVYLYYIFLNHFTVNSTIIDEIVKIVLSKKKNITKIFKEFSVLKQYNQLEINRETADVQYRNDKIELMESVDYNGTKLRKTIGHCPDRFNDSEFICLPSDIEKLYIRTFRKGDLFAPFGMKGHMKLKDYFINEKIPAKIRKTLPLLTDEKDNIIWVTGIRRSSIHKIKGNKECLFVYREKN